MMFSISLFAALALCRSAQGASPDTRPGGLRRFLEEAEGTAAELAAAVNATATDLGALAAAVATLENNIPNMTALELEAADLKVSATLKALNVTTDDVEGDIEDTVDDVVDETEETTEDVVEEIDETIDSIARRLTTAEELKPKVTELKAEVAKMQAEFEALKTDSSADSVKLTKVKALQAKVALALKALTGASDDTGNHAAAFAATGLVLAALLAW